VWDPVVSKVTVYPESANTVAKGIIIFNIKAKIIDATIIFVLFIFSPFHLLN
jgi:hypothetical protein